MGESQTKINLVQNAIYKIEDNIKKLTSDDWNYIQSNPQKYEKLIKYDKWKRYLLMEVAPFSNRQHLKNTLHNTNFDNINTLILELLSNK